MQVSRHMHADAMPTSSDHNREIAAGLRPNTANLHDVQIDHSTDTKATDTKATDTKATDTKAPTAEKTSPQSGEKREAGNELVPKAGKSTAPDGSTTEVTPKGDGGYTEVVKDKAGMTTYSKSAEKDGSFSDMRTAPDGTMTATEQDAHGNFVKHIISDSGVTTQSHKQDGEGGFVDSIKKPDGSETVHEQKANGDFKESLYKDGQLEHERIRIMNEKGGYSEYSKAKDGSSETHTFDANGRPVPNLPVDAGKPSPTDAGAKDMKDNSAFAKVAAEWARDAGTVASGIKAVTKGMEYVPPLARLAGGLGTPLGLIGRAAQVGGTAMVDSEEGKKELLAVGVGTVVRYGLGGATAAGSLGLGAPGAFALGTGAGAVAEECTRDALHGKNCGDEYLQWQQGNFDRAVKKSLDEGVKEFEKTKAELHAREEAERARHDK